MKRNLGKIVVLFCIIAGMVTFLSACSKKTGPVKEKADLTGFKNQEIFITPQELKTKLDSNNLVILDANKPNLYSKGHIPGAISVGFQKLSNTEGKPGDKGWGTAVHKNTLVKRLKELGIDNKKTVVFYSDVLKGPGADGRYVWQLRMAGMNNVKLLYGGLNYWKKLGYDISKEKSKPVPVKNVEVRDYDTSYVASLDYMKNNLEKIKVIDARTEKEFSGDDTSHGEARGGHIKGAIFMEWKELLDDNGIPKEPKEIKKIMKDKGITTKDDFVVY